MEAEAEEEQALVVEESHMAGRGLAWLGREGGREGGARCVWVCKEWWW